MGMMLPEKLCQPSTVKIGEEYHIVIPMRLESLSNGSYGNRFAHTKRKNRQKEIVTHFLRAAVARSPMPWPIDVSLVRMGPREPDDDNVTASFKYIRDAIAEYLGVDDGDKSKICFVTDSLVSKFYGVRITLKPRDQG